MLHQVCATMRANDKTNSQPNHPFSYLRCFFWEPWGRDSSPGFRGEPRRPGFFRANYHARKEGGPMCTVTRRGFLQGTAALLGVAESAPASPPEIGKVEMVSKDVYFHEGDLLAKG